MKTALIAMLAVAAFAASPTFAQAGTGAKGTLTADGRVPASDKSYHYWLHPRQGMVKVDKTSHMMLVPRRQARGG